MRVRTAPRFLLPILLGVWLLAGGVVSASSLPDPVVDNRYPLQLVGAGELRWLGLPIYDASLWTSSGRHAGFTAGDTVALSLWYRRSFTRDQLLEVTATAWRKLGQVDPAQRERWLTELRSFWTDVVPGQNVTTVVLPGGPTRFYDQRGRIGQVDDPAFGPAFLSIWLDPRSLVSDLRIRLLGGPAATEMSAAN
jgi:Chalcone isomerase-like